MASNKFDIKINLDSKSIDLGAAAALNLNKQLKVLKDFAQRNEGKLSAEQFAILSKQINDTKDNIKSLNARSGEFFDTLTLLPGPIGEISRQFSSTLELLKTFSSFSLSTISSQFKGLGADISEVIKSFFGLKSASEGVTTAEEAQVVAQEVATVTTAEQATTTEVLAAAETEVAVAATEATVATEAQTVAQQGLTLAQRIGAATTNILKIALKGLGIGLLITAVIALVQNWEKFKNGILNLIPGLKTVTNFIGGLVQGFTDLVGITNEVERAEAQRQKTYEKAKSNTDIANAGIERQIKLLKAQGGKEEEVYQLQKKLLLNRIKDLEVFRDKSGVIRGKEATEYKDLLNELAVLDAEENKRKTELGKKAGETLTEQNKKELERKKKGLDAAIELEINKENTSKEALKKLLDERKNLELQNKDLTKSEIALIEQKYTKRLNDAIEEDDKRREEKEKERLQQLKDFEEKKSDIETGAIENANQKQLAERERKYKKDLENLEADKEFIKASEEEKNRLRNLLLEGYYIDRDNILEQQAQAEFQKEQERSQKRIDLQIAEIDAKQKIQTAYIDYISGLGSLLAQIAGKSKALAKAAIIIEKGAEIAKILVASNAAIAKISLRSALIPPILPPGIPNPFYFKAKTADAFDISQTKISSGLSIAGIIAGAAKGLGEIDSANESVGGKITAPEGQSQGAIKVVANRASGGLITGAGSSTSDSIPTLLSNGEYVINANATSRFLPLLSAINQEGLSTNFALASSVNSSPSSLINALSQPSIGTMKPIKTYVTATDMSNQQQFNRTLKQRSLL